MKCDELKATTLYVPVDDGELHNVAKAFYPTDDVDAAKW